MIWNSVIGMTIADVAILGIVTVTLYLFFRSGKSFRRNSTLRHGSKSIVFGLGLTGLFYFADLMIMHALPLFTIPVDAMQIMTDLHLNYRWPVSFISISAISVGLVLIIRGGVLAEPVNSTGRISAGKLPYQRLAPIAIVAVVGVAVSIAAFLTLVRELQSEARQRFAHEAEAYAGVVRNALVNAEEALDTIAGLFSASSDVTAVEFEIFTAAILRRHLELRALSWFPRVAGPDRDAFEQRVRQERKVDFRIRDVTQGGDLVRAAESDEYFPALFSAPSDRPGIERTWGFNPISNETRRAAFETARDSGQRAATARIKLVSIAGDQFAIAIIQPIYENGAELDTVEARRAALAGYVTGAFRVAGLVETRLRDTPPRGLDIYIHDEAAGGEPEFLYYHASRTRSESVEAAPRGTLRAGLFSVWPLEVGGRSWSALFKPAPGYFTATLWPAWMLLAGGLLLTATLALYQRSVLLQNVHVSRLVRQRTKALPRAEKRLGGILENANDAVISVDSDQRIILFNQAAQRIFGYESGEVLGHSLDMLLPPRYRARHGELVREFAGAAEISRSTSERPLIAGLRKDGSEFPAEASISKLALGDQLIFTTMVRDVSERRQAEERFRRVFEEGPLGMVLVTTAGQFLAANDRFCEITGYSEKELVGRSIVDITHPDDVDADLTFIAAADAGDAFTSVTEKRYIKKSGETVWVNVTRALIGSADGKSRFGLGMIEDITQRKEAEKALRKTERSFQHARRLARLGVWEWNIATGKKWWSDEVYRIFGVENDGSELDHDSYLDQVHPDDADRLRRRISKCLETGENVEFEYRIILPDGDEKVLRATCALTTDEAGNPISLTGATQDITESRKVEEQLRQALKMEAVGHLTGGLAHDFNNLLAIIEGYLSLLDENLREERDVSPAEARKFIGTALRAGRRGAELTHRLLAFSRKQPLRPVILDVNMIVEGMEHLLERTLGEDVDLRWHLEAVDWLAEVDESQLENVILNLAVNARDAMPDGGRLTIETAEVTLDDEYAQSHLEVTAGDYVMLAVSDTGTGMDVETLAQVFEPFFTTKEVGRGTGLGLSMVFGFAKQSGGHVAIYSEPGTGTTVRLYVPRAAAQTETVAKVQEACSGGGHETILVVEDDEDVRDVATRMLERLGYTVFAAQDGRTALTILENEGPCDLLLTDVVLPGGMSGPELAAAAQEKASGGVKVLYMSGYTENAILHHGRLAQGVNLIGKPFSYTSLGARVREALASES